MITKKNADKFAVSLISGRVRHVTSLTEDERKAMHADPVKAGLALMSSATDELRQKARDYRAALRRSLIEALEVRARVIEKLRERARLREALRQAQEEKAKAAAEMEKAANAARRKGGEKEDSMNKRKKRGRGRRGGGKKQS